MRSKVFRASFLVSVIICAITMVMTAVLLFRMMENQTFQELREEADILSGIGDEPDDFSRIESTHRITLVSDDGTVLYDNEADYRNMPNHNGREEIEEARKTGSGQSVRRSDTMLTETLYYAKLLSGGNVLRVSVSQNSIWAILRSLVKPAIIMFMCVVLVSLFLSGQVTDSILKPINNIDLDHPEQNDTYEEIRPLLKKIDEQQKEILEQQRNELKKEENYRREYTANVSHELKTPLTSISGFAELMMNGGVPEDMVKDFSHTIYNEAARMISLVNDIIQLSQLDDDTITYEWTEPDLYEMARSTITHLEPTANRQKVHLHLGGGHCTAECVEKVMAEILYNVMDNAIKYNRENGNVRIMIHDLGSQVEIVVKDSGIGIPKEDIPRIFERFYRVDKSHSREIGGTGLGLSIVKHGARLLHMQIEVTSEVGKGTTVRMVLPKKRTELSETSRISENCPVILKNLQKSR